MAMDFTVIQAVRQRFGDSTVDAIATNTHEYPLEQEAPFVGPSKDFSFSCPNVDSRQMGVLQFESLGVTAGLLNFLNPSPPRNIIRINNVDIPGGITPAGWVFQPPGTQSGSVYHFWKTHSLLVPANVLIDNNVLHIESVMIPKSGGYQLDNFIIDNVVVFYKTFR